MCEAPKLHSNLTTDDITYNKRQYKKAYEDCLARFKALIGWYQGMSAPTSTKP